MAGVKISDLSTLTPLTTDLIVLDRPTTGPGAPVTGHVTVANLKALIDETGNEYWQSTTSGQIFTTASLASIVGILQTAYLSSSFGARVTGSATFKVIAPGQSVIISGSANNSTPALQVVDDQFAYTFFEVDPANGKVKAISPDPTKYIELDPGAGSLSTSFANNYVNIQADYNGAYSVITLGTTVGSATGSIISVDSGLEAAELQLSGSTLDLLISALKFNGDAGAAGYVLTSSAPNAPGWAPVSSLVTPQPEYWLSTANEAVYTTGSALFSGPGGVGVDSPALLGTDMFFFVSGAIGSKDTAVTGTAVFGGDVVISGTLHGGSPLKIGSGLIVTSSAIFKVDEPSQTVIISGSGNSGARALDVIDSAFGPGQEYSVFYVDPGNFNVVVGTQDPSNYIALTNGSTDPKASIISGSNRIELSPTINRISIKVLDTLPTASIRVEDQYEFSANLDLQISSLQVNGDAGLSGYVLTSNGDSSAPTWQAAPGGGAGDQFWFSTVNEAVYTTGSALFSGPGGVGVDSPALLGTDIFFFVSGAIGSKDTAATGTAVFGGDVHVSGNLTADGNATVSQLMSVGTDLQVAGILAVTGSSYLLGGTTGSNGLELSGSALFVGAGGVVVGPDSTFYVSGSAGTNSANKSVFGGTVHVSGNIQLNFNTSIQSRNSSSNDYANIVTLVDATNLGYGNNLVAFGDDTKTAGFGYLANNNVVALITGSNEGYFSGSYQFPQGLSGSLTHLTDGTSYLIAGNNVTITSESNGAITITSTGGGSSPEFWFSTGTNESYTTGSVYISAGANGNQNLIKFDVSGSEFSSLGSNLFYPARGSYIVVDDIPVADASWSPISGTLKIGAASVMASGSGGGVYIFAGDGGYASGSTPVEGIEGGQIFLYPGAGGASDDTAIGGGGGGTIIGTAGQGGSGYTIAGTGGFVSFSGGVGGGKSDSNTTDQFTAGAGGAVYLDGGTGGSPFTPGHIDFIGGQGGDVSITGGIGGISEGLTNSGGQGGAVTIYGGTGGNTTGGGTGGAGGSVIIQPGSSGLDATGQTYNAGNFEVYGGTLPFASASNNASIARFGIASTGSAFPNEFKGFNYIIMNDPVDDPGGSPSSYTDMFLYVSGAIGSKGTLTRGVSIFGGDTLVSGTMNIEGGLRTPPTIVTSLPYTASITDYIIAVSASAGPGVALPSTALDGRNYIVKDVSGSAAVDNIVVSVDGGGLIDGASSYAISINRGSATFVYFGTSIGWGVI